MNEILFLLTIIANFAGVIMSFRLFGKRGVFGWVVMAAVVANIESTKCVDLFGMSTTLGTVIYSSSFLCTDILSEFYGDKEAKKAIYQTFAFMLVSMLLFQISLLFIPNGNDVVNESLHNVFYLVPRITIASILTYLLSNRLDIYLYQWIRERSEHLWLRNNGATIIAQTVDTVIFTLGAFAGVYDFQTLIEIMFTTFIIKVFVAFCDTPFLYWARHIVNKKKIEL